MINAAEFEDDDLQQLLGERGNALIASGFTSVVDALDGETDRGAVIIAAAWLEESLTGILNKYLLQPSKSKDELFSPGKPLGDFGTKIILAERLRLITKELASPLRMIRKLRNDFAHIASKLSFETTSVKDRVRQILQENSAILIQMGQALEQDNFAFAISENDTLDLDRMILSLGHKHLFVCVCGFLNATLVLTGDALQPSDPKFSTKS